MTRNQVDEGNGSEIDRKIERLLDELSPVDLPPFYRTRLLARIREAARRPLWSERLRSPALAWSVAAVCVAAVVLIGTQARRGSPPAVPGVQVVAAGIDPVTPVDNSVVGAGNVEIVAAIYPPLEDGSVRLYIDDRDVTGLADVADSYVMYSPSEKLEEGEHIVTIEIRDASGNQLRGVSWLFYALNGEAATFDDRI